MLDLTRLLPGGYATMLLADLGAEVIKIEELGRGDWMREPSPVFGGSNALFAQLNRNKKSVALNLKDGEGREVLLRLAQKSDALLEGFRPGVAKRLGIDYEAVRARNAHIVYCSLSGYGQTGPLRKVPGHDINYVAEAGLLGIDTGEAPRCLPLPFADMAGGLFTALAMVAAIKGETGAYIDLAMSDTIVSLLVPHFAQMFQTGKTPTPDAAYLLGGHPSYTVYCAADGKYLTVGALEPKFWRSLCETLGRPQYIDRQYDPALRETMLADFRALFATRERDEWVRRLMAADVPVAAVKTLAEVERSEQSEARGLFREVARELKEVAFPAEVHGAHEAPDRPAPQLGEHTREVLARAGYSEAEISGLRERGVVSG